MSNSKQRAVEIGGYLRSFGRSVDRDMVVAYLGVLAPLDDQQFARAIKLGIAKGGNWPQSAAELLQLGSARDEGSFHARAVKAWRDLTIVAERYGMQARVATGLSQRSDGAMVRYALEKIGGWGEFVKPPNHESMAWQRRDFLKFYAEAAMNPQLVYHYVERLQYARPTKTISDERGEVPRLSEFATMARDEVAQIEVRKTR